ncbi:GlpM family protein, partial [Acinetobacter gyllenbergii]
MWALFLKCMLGAGVVLIISVLSKSKAFYIAGLVPLF